MCQWTLFQHCYDVIYQFNKVKTILSKIPKSINSNRLYIQLFKKRKNLEDSLPDFSTKYKYSDKVSRIMDKE